MVPNDGRPRRLHHLTFVVADLGAALGHWRAVLGQEPILEALSGRGVMSARFDLGGVWLVLVEPRDGHGLVFAHLAAHGPGLMLLSLSVDDLDSAVATLSAQNVRPVGPPRAGLAAWRVQDLAPDPATGVQVQLCRDPAEPDAR